MVLVFQVVAKIQKRQKFIKYLTSEEGLALYLEDNTSPQIAVRQSQADLSVSIVDEV